MSEAYAEPQPDDETDEGSKPGFDLMAAIQSPNIAHELDANILASMGSKVCEEYEIDVESRKAAGFDERLALALRLASLVAEAKNYPWPKASNVKFPLIIQAAIEFNSRSYPAVVDGPEIVKGKPLGRNNPDKQAKADRIGRHMSYQLIEEEEEWEEETDELLLRLPILGTMIRKRYFDPVKGRNCSHVISPEDFVVNYKAKRELSVCPRATQVLTFYPHEIKEKQRSGLWRDVELGQASDASNDNEAPHTFLEQHRLWDLDGDDYPEPYIVTVHQETQQVVRVVARFYAEGVTAQNGKIIAIKPYEIFTKYPFIPSPDGSFYDMGFGTLLGPMSDTINTSINQLLDAAHQSNLNSGFIGEGVSVKSGALRFQPGEWKKVGSTGAVLKDNIVPLPAKEPSAVLYNLMVFLIDAAKNLTATQDILSGDTSKANMPVGTTLALIEQGLKTYTSIVKRIHRALKRELAIQYQLNARYLQPEVYFQFQDDEVQTGQSDYQLNDVDVVPVSDPSMATDMQKMGRAQFMQSMKGQGLDDMEINKFVLETAGVDVKRFLPKAPPAPDPKIALESDKLDLEHRKVDTQQALARASIAVDEANAQATMLQTFMAGPQFQAAVAQFIDQRVQQQLAQAGQHGGPQPVQQPDVPGMGGPPADQGVQAIPGGPAGAADGGLGPGGPDGAGGPAQGPMPAGAGEYGMG